MKLQFHSAERSFKERKILCMKYNYSIDGDILNYHALLKLSDDSSHLHILKKNITEEKKYQLEADPLVIDQIRSKLAKSTLDMGYNLVNANSVIQLSEIQGIIYGGMSSRFWMLRKYFNSLEKITYKNDEVPFYAWECITIQTKNREIDLVVKNEKDMDNLILILVSNMQKNKEKIIKQQCFNYRLIRIRSKISFMAFYQLKSIPELIFDQILKTYNDLTLLREIQLEPDELMVQDSEMFKGIQTQSFSATLRMLQRVNM